ncbi:MAG: sugar/nucleoside kinase (ribokinase family) [Janthinobacterium sp.]|jgi:sugar/nucleoside kinase (ribokinase family)
MTDLVVVGMAYFEVFVPPHEPVAAGEELFVEGIHLALGGALNTASVAAALGLQVTLCVPMGGGIVDQAVQLLAGRLNITLVPLAAPDNPAISLVFSNASDRSFVSTAELDVLASLEHLPASAWVHVPGLEEADRLAAPLAKARSEGARISVSGSWSPVQLARLRERSNAPWDLLVLNEKEALAACGDVLRAPELLAGAAASVVVTQGPNGAFGAFDGAALRVPACAAQSALPVDTTGAGDAFCAGLIAALLRGAPPEAALEHGTRAAARILSQVGGLVVDPALMTDLKQRSWNS